MGLFTIKNNKLDRVKQTIFKLEKDIQKLTEENLQTIFNLQFVKHEFPLNNLRIDTLAYDDENSCFVIIEYKRDQNFSVIDQGYAYLSLMLNNKADFILEYNENCGKNLKKDKVDWSQSRVIFISPTFSKYQQQAINFKDLPIELWEVSNYENGLVQYTKLKSPETSESIRKISKKSEVVEKVSEEVKVYTEEDFLDGCPEEIKELYYELKSKILSLSNTIEVIPRKLYIAFKSQSNFVDVRPQKKQIKVWLNLNKGQLDDPKQIAKLMLKDSGEKQGHWGNGDYEIYLSTGEELSYLLTLIKQSYEKNS